MKRGFIFVLLLIFILSLSYGCTIQPACSDNKDNDNDGLIDFPDDPDCSNGSDTTEESTGCCEYLSASGQVSCLNNYKQSTCSGLSNAIFHNQQSCQEVSCGVTTTTMPAEVANCIDTDQMDFEIRGTATLAGTYDVEGNLLTGATTSVDDLCDSSGNLIEYYCENNVIKSEIVDCANAFSPNYICMSGTCLEQGIA